MIYSEVKDGDGAGIMNAPVTGLIIAVDTADTSKYIVYAFVKDKAGNGYANRIVLSNNELSLGPTNEQGTSVINGGTNVKQFMLGLGID